MAALQSVSIKDRIVQNFQSNFVRARGLLPTPPERGVERYFRTSSTGAQRQPDESPEHGCLLNFSFSSDADRRQDWRGTLVPCQHWRREKLAGLWWFAHKPDPKRPAHLQDKRSVCRSSPRTWTPGCTRPWSRLPSWCGWRRSSCSWPSRCRADVGCSTAGENGEVGGRTPVPPASPGSPAPSSVRPVTITSRPLPATRWLPSRLASLPRPAHTTTPGAREHRPPGAPGAPRRRGRSRVRTGV
jgi:hypothetical protein